MKTLIKTSSFPQIILQIALTFVLLISPKIYAETIIATGTIESKQTQYVLMPLVQSFNGKISEMVEEGTFVETGQRLIRIDGTDINSRIESLVDELDSFEASSQKTQISLKIDLNNAQIAFEQAKTNLKIAQMKADVPLNYIGELAFKQNQLTLKNSEKIHQKTSNDLNEVKTKQEESIIEKNLGLEQKNKKLNVQQNLLKGYTINAKQPGYVVYASHPWNGSKIQLGDQLQSGWEVLTVSQNTDLQIIAWVNAIDIPHIHLNQTVNIQFDAFMNSRYKGYIASLSEGGGDRKIWGNGLYYKALIKLKEQPKNKLLVGMSAMIEINLEGNSNE
jgi:multidrug resistance efflux pump